MTDVRAISEPVRFDHQAADDLIARFRTIADELEQQVELRISLAGVAEREWRGLHARNFRGRMDQCVSDAHMLAASMRDAARKIEHLADLARREQKRRDKAQQWEYEQAHRSAAEQLYDAIVEPFIGQHGPPDPDPIEPEPVDVGPQRHISGRS